MGCVLVVFHFSVAADKDTLSVDCRQLIIMVNTQLSGTSFHSSRADCRTKAHTSTGTSDTCSYLASLLLIVFQHFVPVLV